MGEVGYLSPMIGIVKFLAGTVLGVVLGWSAGYLRVPMMEQNASFWVGFAACLALVLFVVGLLYVWNKNAFFARLIGKTSTAKDSAPAVRTYAFVWILVALFIVLGGSVSSWMIFRQNQLFVAQTQHQNQRIQEQSELIGSIRSSQQVFLMGNVLDKVDDELDSDPNRTLSDATIARIAALGYSCKPYAYFAGDSLYKKKMSPERGQLLLALANMRIDSGSFAKIKHDTPFSGADLNGTDLKGADLSGIDLRGADLRSADLSGANLSGANLKGADLWGAILNDANLGGTNLNRVDLRWAELNSANLKMANLDGTDLSNAKLRRADLSGATFRWAISAGAMFNDANLSEVDMLGTNLARANFRNANLSGGNLLRVDLVNANLEGAQLTEARVDEKWVENTEKWHIIVSPEIQTNYQVVSDTSGKYQGSKFLLLQN
jgi:uncharacterized protein YjbI with pentapeptide repeats